MHFRGVDVNFAAAKGHREAQPQDVPGANIPVGCEGPLDTLHPNLGQENNLVLAALHAVTILHPKKTPAKPTAAIEVE